MADLDEAELLAALKRMVTPEAIETLSMKKVMKQLRGVFGDGVKERKAWVSEQVTAIVQTLLDAGADLEAKNGVRPTRRLRAPAAARRRSLTRRVRCAAAPFGSMAGPPSFGPATTGTPRPRRRCWSRGQTSTPRTV